VERELQRFLKCYLQENPRVLSSFPNCFPASQKHPLTFKNAAPDKFVLMAHPFVDKSKVAFNAANDEKLGQIYKVLLCAAKRLPLQDREPYFDLIGRAAFDRRDPFRPYATRYVDIAAKRLMFSYGPSTNFVSRKPVIPVDNVTHEYVPARQPIAGCRRAIASSAFLDRQNSSCPSPEKQSRQSEVVRLAASRRPDTGQAV
jgi:hypothetical protein